MLSKKITSLGILTLKLYFILEIFARSMWFNSDLVCVKFIPKDIDMLS